MNAQASKQASKVCRVAFAAVSGMIVFAASGDAAPGQLERDPSNQSALLPGIVTIQSGYEHARGSGPARAFNGNTGDYVNLVAVSGDQSSGTNTAYGVDFGPSGACVLTSAQILSRNASCWDRSRGVVVCGSNDPDWFHNFDIITPPTTHTGRGQWDEVASTSTKAYRYLFIYNPDPTVVAYGPETAEIKFFGYNLSVSAGTGGSVKLGDGDPARSVAAYVSSSAPATLTAVPAEGYAFAKWVGRVDAIVEGSSTDATVQIGGRGELRALFRVAALKEPGQLERDPSSQSALSLAVETIQSGYNWLNNGNYAPIMAFDGNANTVVDLLAVSGDTASGTNTAYGVNLGVDGACVLTSAQILSRNSADWTRSRGVVVCGSNDPDWFHNFDIITPPTTHTGQGQWNEVASTSTKAYRYLFIYNPDPTVVAYGPETAEIRFFGYNLSVSAGAGGSVKCGDDAAASYISAYASLGSPVTITAVPDEGCSFLRWEGRIHAIVGGSSADATIQVGRHGELRAVFSESARKEAGQLERLPSNQAALAAGISTIHVGYIFANTSSPDKAFDGNLDTIVNLSCDAGKTDGSKTGYGVDFGEDGACILAFAQILGRRPSREGFTRETGAVICGSNDPDWFHNFEIITTANAPTDMWQWNTVSSISSKAYRYMFIYNPNPAYQAWGPQTAEIRLFGYNVQASASGKGKIRLGDGEAASSITAYANAERPITLTAIPDSGSVRFKRWEGRTDAIVSGSVESSVIQVGAHAELTAVFGPIPGTMIIIQ